MKPNRPLHVHEEMEAVPQFLKDNKPFNPWVFLALCQSPLWVLIALGAIFK
jgi:hypothetical protein